MRMADIPLSVVILTRDEETNLGACLDSLAGITDVHVLDCGSIDRTIEIATGRGVAVHFHPFEGFGRQRNWAIDNVPHRHDWGFHLDADERFTPELLAEIAEVLGRSPSEGGFFVPSKLMFAGRWLKRAGSYPAYQVRVFHRRRLRFADHGHGQRELTDFPLGRLRQPYLHFAFSKGLDDWFAKHAVYARQEAEQALAGLGPERSVWRSLFGRDATASRRAIKFLTRRLPGRYFLRLLYMLIVKRAILDGSAGVTYAHMLATYEAMIEVHLRLLRRGLKP